MKNLIKAAALAVTGAVMFSSCMKEGEVFDPSEQLEIERPLIKEYVEENYPNAKELNETGIWYEIIEEGELGEHTYEVIDTLNSKWIAADVAMVYTGKLVEDGTTFDKTEDTVAGDTLQVAWNLSTGEPFLIQGFLQALLPKEITVTQGEKDQTLKLGYLFEEGAQPGAHFRIIMPSYYGYGNQTTGKIPANSPLDFEVKVLDIDEVNWDKLPKR
ncbi:MAG TPA: FKBP-type peptidyl-prolyl cis-trans isomerase [Candidatus Sphingobacterium stercoripullorum]|nr:FKBP-type peptidyl-prolyl cis-trans isomerase [Candidatus Sphingobacterium stercoripullorum]